MKQYRQESTLIAAKHRLHRLYTEFDRVIISFSGGKDSGILLNLAIDTARELDKLPVHAFCVDLEGQYAYTTAFIEKMFSRPEVEGQWICLPFNLRNAVSLSAPFWCAWDETQEEKWIRTKPKHPSLIDDPCFFPFFRPRMEFEEFVLAYGEHAAKTYGKTAVCVGIRADESLNRYRTIARRDKARYQNLPWTTVKRGCVTAYPIYDMTVRDVWAINGAHAYAYNEAYDLMFRAGIPLSEMRLCQPYGDDQRKGLHLFHALEADTWARVVARVEGANFGKRHAKDKALGHLRVELPEGVTWEQYTQSLLTAMPPTLRIHYEGKIKKFLMWWASHGFSQGIPDEADKKEEAKKKVPSWRRVAKVLIKNDFWCRGLSFSPTKNILYRLQEGVARTHVEK